MSDNLHTVKTQADYTIAVERAIERIGKTNGSKLPNVNDPKTAAIQELAIAQIISSVAEARAKAAWKAAGIDGYKAGVTTKGVSVLEDTPFVLLAANAKGGARQMSQDRLRAALLKRGINAKEIEVIIEEARGDASLAVGVTATLKM
jgi:hypothetical protein